MHALFFKSTIKETFRKPGIATSCRVYVDMDHKRARSRLVAIPMVSQFFRLGYSVVYCRIVVLDE